MLRVITRTLSFVWLIFLTSNALAQTSQLLQHHHVATRTSSSAPNSCLSGTWVGTYQDNAGESGTFTAILVQTGSTFSGTVTAIGAPGTASPGLYASSINGTISGNSLTFGPITFGNETDTGNGTTANNCTTWSGSFIAPNSATAGTYSGTRTSYSVTLIDPVPNLLAGPAVSQNMALLASASQPVIQGISADGVSQLVVQVQVHASGPPVGQSVQLTLNDSCSAAASDPSADGSISMVSGGNVDPNTNTAVGIYTAPADFVRPECPSDATLTNRTVFLSLPDGSTSPILIVRPPVMLLHGLWSSSAAWLGFPLLNDSRFYVVNADYSSTSGSSVSSNESLIMFKYVLPTISNFKQVNSVAATQVDFVVHSMGGLIARDMALDPQFVNNTTYARGYVHKLITLDTPHNGSQFAQMLQTSDPFCQTLLAGIQLFKGAGAITDLTPGSFLLSTLNNSGPAPLQAHAIVGVANSTQEGDSVAALNIILGAFPPPVRLLCNAVTAPILSQGFTNGIFGGDLNDLIVDQNSQQFGFQGTAVDWTQSTIHTLKPPFFPTGPDAIGDPSNQQRTIDLLNTPVYDPSGLFSPILP